MSGYLLSDFIHGVVNAYTGEFVIGRENLPNGCQYIVLKDKYGKILYEFFHNPENPTKKRDGPPKHAGRRQPYVMLMLRNISKLQCENRLEIMGAIMALSNNVEWNTGVLIRKRPTRPLKSEEFPKLFNCSRSKAFNLLKQMKQLEIIEKADGGYRITEKYIRKGAGKNASKSPKRKNPNVQAGT